MSCPSPDEEGGTRQTTKDEIVKKKNIKTNVTVSSIGNFDANLDNPGLCSTSTQSKGSEPVMTSSLHHWMTTEESPEDCTRLSPDVVMFHKRPVTQQPNCNVYHGRQKLSDGHYRDVAIKLIPHRNVEEPFFFLNHPNLVQIYNFGVFHSNCDQLYIVMELCSMNLEEYVNKHPFDPEKALLFFKQIIAAVEFMHKHDIAHMDITPTNILVSQSGDIIKILYSSKLRGSRALRGITSVIDTLTREPFDFIFKSDIFSLGVVILYLFNHGKHPSGKHLVWQFSDPFLSRRYAGPLSLRDRQLESFRYMHSLSQIALEIPERRRLVNLIDAMLSVEPSDRPSIHQIKEEAFSGFCSTSAESEDHKLWNTLTVESPEKIQRRQPSLNPIKAMLCHVLLGRPKIHIKHEAFFSDYSEDPKFCHLDSTLSISSNSSSSSSNSSLSDYEEQIVSPTSHILDDVEEPTKLQGWFAPRLTKTVEITRKERTVTVGDCVIFFPSGALDHTQTVTTTVEIDSRKWPPGRTVITPSLYIDAQNLKKPLTIKLPTWCVEPEFKEDSLIEVLRYDENGDKWEVIQNFQFTGERHIRFQCQHFSPIVATFRKIVLYWSGLKPILYRRKANVTIALLLNSRIYLDSFDSEMKRTMGNDVQTMTFPALMCNGAQKVRSHVSCDNFNIHEPGPYTHSVNDVLSSGEPDYTRCRIQIPGTIPSELGMDFQMELDGIKLKNHSFVQDWHQDILSPLLDGGSTDQDEVSSLSSPFKLNLNLYQNVDSSTSKAVGTESFGGTVNRRSVDSPMHITGGKK